MTPKELGYSQDARYYSLTGQGRLAEITEGEYEMILRKASKSEFHAELKPFHGIHYLGTAYLVLPSSMERTS